MKRVATYLRCIPSAHRGAGLLAVMLLSIVGSAGAGIIDFETPALGDANELYGNVYESQGVKVTATGLGSLRRESASYPCPGVPEANQAFQAEKFTFGCLCCRCEIQIDFPPLPADPVYHVALEVRGPSPVLRLELYDAGSNLIGSSQAEPAGGSCTLRYRGTLEASAAQPVAYAMVVDLETTQPVDCIAEWACCVEAGVMLIDNILFDGGAVPVRPRSWGLLKINYR
jgi:hypothetical protein